MSQLEMYFQTQGIDLAATRKPIALKEAQSIAHELGESQSLVCIDHVRDVWDARFPNDVWPLGNASGAVFREKCWRYHSMLRSWHKRGNGRRIILWEYQNEH